MAAEKKKKGDRPSHSRLVRTGPISMIKEYDFSPYALPFDAAAEICLYREILLTSPDYIEPRMQLAELLTKLERYDEGLIEDLELSRRRPEDATVLYNLACSYALTTHLEECCETLLAAMALGFDDSKLLREDKDLAALRASPLWARVLMGMGDRPAKNKTEKTHDAHGATDGSL